MSKQSTLAVEAISADDFQTPAALVFKHLFGEADIALHGARPWDLRVHDKRFFRRVLLHGSVGFGESYMEGWWDCAALDQLSARIYSKRVDDKFTSWIHLLNAAKSKLVNLQSLPRAFQVAQRHYNLGNDLYQTMLDRRMIYSCGYWQHADDLDEAQEEKLDLICRKMHLQPGMTVLDIGCGWGGFLKYACEKYGVSGVGITLSEPQALWASHLCKDLPVEIRLQDYRKLEGSFDRIVSVGMFEHVGYKNYRNFIRICHGLLKDQGLFLLHTIGRNESGTGTDPWMEKYIFPNGMVPSIAQIGASAEGCFVVEDCHNFGADYDRTLMAWHQNFESYWDLIKPKYGETFHRMWRFYLLMCAGSFRARHNQLWQLVLAKNPVAGYRRVA